MDDQPGVGLLDHVDGYSAMNANSRPAGRRFDGNLSNRGRRSAAHRFEHRRKLALGAMAR